jgi:hypothetical protein
MHVTSVRDSAASSGTGRGNLCGLELCVLIFTAGTSDSIRRPRFFEMPRRIRVCRRVWLFSRAPKRAMTAWSIAVRTLLTTNGNR